MADNGLGKLTPEFKEAFCNFLMDIPNLTVTCRIMGINPSNVRKARDRDKEFDERVKEAIECGYDMWEEEARRRAIDGVVEPVFYRGCQVMDEKGNPTGIRKYSDALLIQLLKAHRPKVFNRGVTAKLGDGEKVTLTFNIEGE